MQLPQETRTGPPDGELIVPVARQPPLETYETVEQILFHAELRICPFIAGLLAL